MNNRIPHYKLTPAASVMQGDTIWFQGVPVNVTGVRTFGSGGARIDIYGLKHGDACVWAKAGKAYPVLIGERQSRKGRAAMAREIAAMTDIAGRGYGNLPEMLRTIGFGQTNSDSLNLGSK